MKAYAQGMKGDIFLARGRPLEAIQELQEAINLIEKNGATWQAADTFSSLARAYLALPNIDAAYQQAIQSLLQAEKISQPLDLGIAHQILAEVEAARKKLGSRHTAFPSIN